MRKGQKSSWRSTLLVALCLSILLGGVIGPATAQDAPQISRFGYDGFRLLLQGQGLSAQQSNFTDVLEQPDDYVLVLMGDLSSALPLLSRVKDFAIRGGSVLVASDLGYYAVDQVRFWEGPVISTGAAYEGIQDCPIVTRFAPHPLFEGVNAIVTNRPGSLAIRRNSSCREIARFDDSIRRRRERVSPTVMATFEPVSGGRMLLLADHSMLINETLVHGDNLKFAGNLARWLAEPGRRRLVFVEDGHIQPEWQLSGQIPPIPLGQALQAALKNGLPPNLPLPPGSFVAMTNQFLSDPETTNVINRTIVQATRPNLHQHVWRLILIAGAVVAAAFAFRWMFGTPWQPESWRYHAKRQRQLMANSESWGDRCEKLRALVQNWFDAQLPTWRDQVPQAVDHNGQHHPARGELLHLWQVATSAEPFTQLSPYDAKSTYRRGLRELTSIQRLLQSGQLRLK